MIESNDKPLNLKKNFDVSITVSNIYSNIQYIYFIYLNIFTVRTNLAILMNEYELYYLYLFTIAKGNIFNYYYKYNTFSIISSQDLSIVPIVVFSQLFSSDYQITMF